VAVRGSHAKNPAVWAAAAAVLVTGGAALLSFVRPGT
jgi:hypothetical protein